MTEHCYDVAPPTGRLVHHYGPRVHVLSDPWALRLLGRLGHADTRTPALLSLVRAAYRRLAHAMTELLPTEQLALPTRMVASEPRAVTTGAALDPNHQVVIADVMRAGIMPSQVIYEAMLEVMDPDAVRVDHLFMQRVSDPETGRVTGIDLSGAKIGGPVEGATVVVPDPMGATGGSLDRLLRYYREEVGEPARFVLAHLMVTPEYLRRITQAHPDAWIYALRVDRGLSSEDVLGAVPGARWDEERGLDAHDYIVPGAGGVGELLYNANA
jgi:uracil phosphoribosyltransferase